RGPGVRGRPVGRPPRLPGARPGVRDRLDHHHRRVHALRRPDGVRLAGPAVARHRLRPAGRPVALAPGPGGRVVPPARAHRPRRGHPPDIQLALRRPAPAEHHQELRPGDHRDRKRAVHGPHQHSAELGGGDGPRPDPQPRRGRPEPVGRRGRAGTDPTALPGPTRDRRPAREPRTGTGTARRAERQCGRFARPPGPPRAVVQGGQGVITPPRRSVTRFFIPLIDVLILLFCIFLLMPFVSTPARPESEPETRPDTKAVPPPSDLEKLKQERDEALARLERFRKDQSGRLLIRVVEIDPKTGDLRYYTGGGWKKVAEEEGGKRPPQEGEQAVDQWGDRE